MRFNSKDDFEPSTTSVGPVLSDQSINLSIAPVPHALSGVITEAAPTEASVIEGAKIEIMTGSNKGRSVKTDPQGRYVFTGLWGEFDVEISRSGYETRTIRTVLRGADSKVDSGLLPVRREVNDRFSVPFGSFALREATFSIPIHHSGAMKVTTRVCIEGCNPSALAWACAEVLDGSSRVVARAQGDYDSWPWFPAPIEVIGGQIYKVRVSACHRPGFPPRPDIVVRWYDVEVTHPN